MGPRWHRNDFTLFASGGPVGADLYGRALAIAALRRVADDPDQNGQSDRLKNRLSDFGSFPLGRPTPLHSFAFENQDVWVTSTCRLNRHGQSLAVWRKLDMLCVGHLAISLLSELESAGIHAARR